MARGDFTVRRYMLTEEEIADLRRDLEFQQEVLTLRGRLQEIERVVMSASISKQERERILSAFDFPYSSD